MNSQKVNHGILPNNKIAGYIPINPPIESISGIWRFVCPPGFRTHTYSLPDHLLQLVLSGSYVIQINKCQYTVQAGDLIYYYANEDVQWLSNEQEVIFYSVGFRSIMFRPIPIDKRVFHSTATTRNAFEQLYEASNLPRNSDEFALGTHAALLKILYEIQHTRQPTETIDLRTRSWWELENRIRSEHRFRPRLDELAELCYSSRASIVRLCRQATGMSPMKRIRQIRMEEAKGLLIFSPMNITEIARYLGYGRVHEFSREFAAYYGSPPSQHRK
jgi:AraC-like DNA-binding protein